VAGVRRERGGGEEREQLSHRPSLEGELPGAPASSAESAAGTRLADDLAHERTNLDVAVVAVSDRVGIDSIAQRVLRLPVRPLDVRCRQRLGRLPGFESLHRDRFRLSFPDFHPLRLQPLRCGSLAFEPCYFLSLGFEPFCLEPLGFEPFRFESLGFE